MPTRATKSVKKVEPRVARPREGTLAAWNPSSGNGTVEFEAADFEEFSLSQFEITNDQYVELQVGQRVLVDSERKTLTQVTDRFGRKLRPASPLARAK
jgi:hypothetical protein